MRGFDAANFGMGLVYVSVEIMLQRVKRLKGQDNPRFCLTIDRATPRYSTTGAGAGYPRGGGPLTVGKLWASG